MLWGTLERIDLVLSKAHCTDLRRTWLRVDDLVVHKDRIRTWRQAWLVRLRQATFMNLRTYGSNLHRARLRIDDLVVHKDRTGSRRQARLLW